MMNIGKYIPWAAMGQIIGAVIVIPLGYYLINKFCYSNKYNNDAESYSKGYIDNSAMIKVVMPPYDSDKYIGKYLMNEMSIPLNSRSDGLSNTLIASTITFYCESYKKYFIIMSFGDYSIEEWNNAEVILYVNRDDLKSVEYGTKENPVPVLQVKGVNASIRINNKDYDKAYMDSFYRNNVIRYLKYKMPKEEFERRFKHKE